MPVGKQIQQIVVDAAIGFGEDDLVWVHIRAEVRSGPHVVLRGAGPVGVAVQVGVGRVHRGQHHVDGIALGSNEACHAYLCMDLL